MPRSQSDIADLQCPACGASFRREVWLIVDRDERPDLIELILDGTLHRARCPACGAEGDINHPLLLHDGRREQIVAALPLTVQSEHAARELVGDLLRRLIDALPPASRKPYLGDVELVPELDGLRSSLIEQAGAEHQDRLDHRLTHAIEALLNLSDSTELEGVVATHRAPLLDDRSDAALAQLASQAQAQGDFALHQNVQQARALVQQLRSALQRRRAALHRLLEELAPLSDDERALLPVLRRICAAVDPQDVYAERIQLAVSHRDVLDRLLDRLTERADAQGQAEAAAFLHALAASLQR
jgi:hypothetical protein